MSKKPVNFFEISCEAPEPRSIQLNEKATAAEALNFMKLECEQKKTEKPKTNEITVADELNARLGMLYIRNIEAKPIKRLVKSRPISQPTMYKFQCYCPMKKQKSHNTSSISSSSNTGQIIIDRDVLTREEHLCFLATPRKYSADPKTQAGNVSIPTKKPRFFYKKVTLSACTARVEQLAIPHPIHIKETMRLYKNILSPRNIKALQTQMQPKPPVEPLTLERALEYMEEDQRLKRVARQIHRRRCKSLKKRILKRQRVQMRKIVCVLFEEMKDFLLNDQFIIDGNSPLCGVLLERIKDFTDKEFYTTCNLPEYQRILANNLTVWINKFISNLNIYLAPQQSVQKQIMHNEDPEKFVPISDYISVSEPEGEEVFEDPGEYLDYMDYTYEDYVSPESDELLPPEEAYA